VSTAALFQRYFLWLRVKNANAAAAYRDSGRWYRANDYPRRAVSKSDGMARVTGGLSL